MNGMTSIVLEGDSERDSDHDEQWRVIRLDSTPFLLIDNLIPVPKGAKGSIVLLLLPAPVGLLRYALGGK
jgi:hypothetical protein